MKSQRAVAVSSQDGAALAANVRFAETGVAGQFILEVDVLIAVVFKCVEQSGHVLRPAMPVQLCHACHSFGEDWMQIAVQVKEVAATVDKKDEILRIVQVEATGKAGQDKAQAENVGQRIVMPDLVFPGDIARQVNWVGKLFSPLADLQIDAGLLTLIDLHSHSRFANDFDGEGLCFLKLPNPG